jgi:glycosyltransferase involved in cell wall biosynthesis
MKILQVYPYFYPAWSYGGVTRVAYEISKHLVNRGHEVTVYTTDALDNKSRATIQSYPTYIEGIKTYYFRNLSNYLTYKYHLPLPLEMPFRIKKEVKKFNIIHLHGYRHSLNVLMHHYAKKYRIPYVLKAGGSLPRIHSMHGRKRIFDIFFGYRILKDADKIIARNKREVEQYKNMGVNEDRIEVIPAGINTSKYDNLPQKGAFRRKYSIRDEEKVVLYLGRIHRIKGLDLLVRTFAGLLKKFDDVRLAIVGPDDGFMSVLRRYIQNLRVDNKILFTGPLYERDKLEAYVDADAYVLPSRYEIFGITILEAWACSTPVIVTDRCGIADLVKKVGYVVEYDENQLQDAIFKILSDEELRKRLGAEGRKLVREEFNWDRVVGKIERLYETVLAK